jgi:predicted permease
MSAQGVRWKIVSGIVLLIATPVLLFEKPVSKPAIVPDIALVIWWAFIIWLLVTGFREPRPTDST